MINIIWAFLNLSSVRIANQYTKNQHQNLPRVALESVLTSCTYGSQEAANSETKIVTKILFIEPVRHHLRPFPLGPG